MIYKQFYSELGKLLYAIADIDGVITPQEKKVLQNSVQKELVAHEQHVDEFGTDAAYYAEIEFDFLDEQIADAESAFESFIGFIENHHTALDKNIINACKHIAKELAKAYRGTNKKEKILIEKLKHTLDKLEIKK
jgi:hypothetical protein